MSTFLRGRASSSPRRGSVSSCSWIRRATVCRPSPRTWAGWARVAATTRPPTTSRRCSAPGARRSTRTPPPSAAAWRKAARTRSPAAESPAAESMKTPRPLSPSRVLTTTGSPISRAAAQASSASSTGRPSGTGTPAARSSVRVNSLSDAIARAMAPVRSVSAVRIRLWRLAWPNWTRLPRGCSRRVGMPRASAARRMARVLGSRPTRPASSRSAPSVAARSKGRSCTAARQSARAASRAARPSSSCSYWTTTRQTPGVAVGRVRLNRTSAPASAWSSSVTCSSAWARSVPHPNCSRNVPPPTRQRCWARDGNQAVSRSVKPGSSSERASCKSSRSTQASRTGKAAQMLGPRRAETFRNTIQDSPGKTGQSGPPRPLGAHPRPRMVR
jgi:hypothetical protein